MRSSKKTSFRLQACVRSEHFPSRFSGTCMLWAIVTKEKTAPSPLGFRLRKAECVNQEGWDLTRTQTSFCLPSFGSIKGIHHEFLNILLSIKRHLRRQKGPNTVVMTLNFSCGRDSGTLITSLSTGLNLDRALKGIYCAAGLRVWQAPVSAILPLLPLLQGQGEDRAPQSA